MGTLAKYKVALGLIRFNKCPICSKYSTPNLRHLSIYCSSKCAQYGPESKLKRKQTCLKKYGVDCPAKVKKFLEKARDTSLERHGVSHISKLKSFQEKKKKTSLKKYGVKHSIQRKEVQAKVKATLTRKYGVKCSFQSEVVKAKITATLLERYGVAHALQAQQFKDKQVATTIKRHGVDNGYKKDGVRQKSQNTMMERHGSLNPMQANEAKEKYKATCLERYGVNNPFKSKLVRQKSKNTMLERYGVEYASQHPELLVKIQDGGHRYKNYLLGQRIVKVQGYEDQALDYVRSYGVKVKQITVSTESRALTFPYTTRDGKEKIYVPDFYIKRKKSGRPTQVVEVKSIWTLTQSKQTFQNNVEKAKAVVGSKYDYVLMLMDGKGNRIIIPKNWYEYRYSDIMRLIKTFK